MQRCIKRHPMPMAQQQAAASAPGRRPEPEVGRNSGLPAPQSQASTPVPGRHHNPRPAPQPQASSPTQTGGQCPFRTCALAVLCLGRIGRRFQPVGAALAGLLHACRVGGRAGRRAGQGARGGVQEAALAGGGCSGGHVGLVRHTHTHYSPPPKATHRPLAATPGARWPFGWPACTALGSPRGTACPAQRRC